MNFFFFINYLFFNKKRKKEKKKKKMKLIDFTKILIFSLFIVKIFASQCDDIKKYEEELDIYPECVEGKVTSL